MDDQTRVIEALSAARIFRDYRFAFQAATGVQLFIDRLTIPPRVADTLIINSSIKIEKITPEHYRAAIPIRDGTHTVALLHTGLISNTIPAAEGQKLDGEPLAETLPFFPISRFLPYLSLLAIFAEQLGSLSNQLVIHQNHCEPAIVLKARQYVETRFREPIELQEVARYASVSTFYLCKLFKKSTGINFSNYVTRVRMEAAKEMLVKPTVRINEVALDVGFRSLSHFNRVFRRFIGASPREYRRTLIGAASRASITKMTSQ